MFRIISAVVRALVSGLCSRRDSLLENLALRQQLAALKARNRVGCCRQELLDHVVVANEAHLRRLLREYVAYHHEDRPHCGLGKQTPMRRAAQPKPSAAAKAIALPRVGGATSSLRVARRGAGRTT